MSYVEDFLDINANLPRDFIRLVKLMREVDEKSVTINKNLIELRKEYINYCKSKIRNEKFDNETSKKIEKDFNSLLILSDHKHEIEKELSYLCEFHLKKSNEIIDNYSKYIQTNIENGLIIPQAEDRPLPLYEESFSQPTSKKKEYVTTKSKELGSSSNSSFLMKKRKNTNMIVKKQKEEHYEEIIPEPFNEATTKEELYCICNGPSHGDMVACSNEGCKLEWFHFACVDLVTSPVGDWFCPVCTSASKKPVKDKKKKK